MRDLGEPKATQRADDVEDDLVVNFHAFALWPVRFDCGHRGLDRPQHRAHLHCGLAVSVTRDGRLHLNPIDGRQRSWSRSPPEPTC